MQVARHQEQFLFEKQWFLYRDVPELDIVLWKTEKLPSIQH